MLLVLYVCSFQQWKVEEDFHPFLMTHSPIKCPCLCICWSWNNVVCVFDHNLFMCSCYWLKIPLFLVITIERIGILGILVVHVLVFLGMFDHYEWPYYSMFRVVFDFLFLVCSSWALISYLMCNHFLPLCFC